MELFSQYAVAAALEAVKNAELDMEKEDSFRVGVSVGSGIGSLQDSGNGSGKNKRKKVRQEQTLLWCRR